MATTNLGKVSVTPKGAWNSSNAYEKLDIVTSGGNGYIALKDVPSGTAITNTSYWLKIVAKGDKGDTGEISGASASISGGYGSPSVSVTEGGTSTDRSFAFAFSNLKGNGIESVALLSTSGEEKTYRMTFSDGTHFDYVVTDGEVTEESLAETLEDYAKTDGYYEDLTSGSTEEVISNVKITDQEPYTFRTSGGNAEIGSREEDTLVGVSVAFNQLLQNQPYSTSSDGLTFTVDDDGLLTISGTSTKQSGYFNFYEPRNTAGLTSGHVYFINIMPKVDSGTTNMNVVALLFGNGGDIACYSKGGAITKQNTAVTGFSTLYTRPSYTFDGTLSFYRNIIDLTLAFGSDIADYLYTLEQAQAGEGVALAKKLGLNKYLGYNAGTLYSAQTDAHKMVGFNQWDEEWEVSNYSTTTGGYISGSYDRICSKNFIPCLPNVTYFYQIPSGKSNMQLLYYDANKNYLSYTNFSTTHTFTTPSGCYFMKFNTGGNYGGTYNHDICISIHWDNSRDTDYEPYVLHNYPIDPVVLRGILKKDADGNIYADGDTYEADGTVTRKYGIVDLGSLNWNYSSGDGWFQVAHTHKTRPGICGKYPVVYSLGAGFVDKSLAIVSGYLAVKDSAYTDAATFKTAMSGVYLVYELAEPTTEQATPFTTPQIVDNWGTEEYPDYAVAQGDREYSVPMGHITLYPISIRDKVEASADNPSNDGVYILQISGGKATYIPLIIEDELPTMPTQDGTYTLKTVVSSGTATLSWVAE